MLGMDLSCAYILMHAGAKSRPVILHYLVLLCRRIAEGASCHFLNPPDCIRKYLLFFI